MNSLVQIVRKTLTRSLPLIDVSISATNGVAFETLGWAMGSIQCPTALIGTGFTFEVSNDGTNWDVVQADDDGTADSEITWGANQVFPIPIRCFMSRFTRIVSNDTETSDLIFTVCLAG